MRPLLLLLLAFLLPLQLLAAPVVAPQPYPVCAQAMADGKVADSLAQAQLSMVAAAAGMVDAAGGDLDDDADAPSAQGDIEDHALPVPLATPALVWQSFPHVFAPPPGGSSFVHDQLRPPPLA